MRRAARAATQPVPVLLDTLGGYRLLRTIGVGSRAEVLLAHPVGAAPEGPPVVIKVYGGAVSDESIIAEIEALGRAQGEHVVRLVDVTSTGEGAPAVILERHASGSLARLLSERASLDAGEVVTILAPLATTLARLHDAGVAHGAVGPPAVLFDPTGTPTLACFGRATLIAPGLPVALLEAEQAVLDDVLAYAALAADLLDSAGAAALAHRARTEAAPGRWLLDFADALFDIADPLPVDLRPRPELPLLPARVIAARPVVVDQSVPASAPAPAWRQQVRRARESLGRVRRPVWVVAGASLAALVIALVAVPQSTAPAAEAPSAQGSSAVPTAPVVQQGPVTGDDPVAAALVLMTAREQCIRDLDAACFDDLDQAGSAAREEDRELVGAILAGERAGVVPVLDPKVVVLIQRLGDSALVSLGPDSEPASVLLVKGEAGWRIRDYVAG